MARLLAVIVLVVASFTYVTAQMNATGAITGTLLGVLSGAWYLYMVHFAGMTPWIGIDQLRFGIISSSIKRQRRGSCTGV